MSRSIRAIRLAAPALALAAFAAACSDGPSAPLPLAAPQAAPIVARAAADSGVTSAADLVASPVLTPTATYTTVAQVRIANSAGQLVGGTWVNFHNISTGYGASVQDNGSGDLDARSGYLQAKLYSGQATNALRATVWSAPIPYSTHGARKELPGAGSLADFGTITLKTMPHVVADVRRHDGSTLIAGGGLTVTRMSDKKVLRTAMDNGAGDVDPTIGRIKAYFDSDQQVAITETTIPTGFQAPWNLTVLAQVPFGSSTNIQWYHRPFNAPK
jgi:hypothetical protein